MTVKPCLRCGVLVRDGNRCPPCTTEAERDRGSSTARGYGSTWRRLAARTIAARPWCAACGTTGTRANPLTVDHIVPLARGGTSDPTNLQTLCRRCNSGKGATPTTVTTDPATIPGPTGTDRHTDGQPATSSTLHSNRHGHHPAGSATDTPHPTLHLTTSRPPQAASDAVSTRSGTTTPAPPPRGSTTSLPTPPRPPARQLRRPPGSVVDLRAAGFAGSRPLGRV